MLPLSAVILVATGFALGWFLCSRTQRNRLEAAKAFHELTSEAVSVATKYNERLAARSDREANLAEEIAQMRHEATDRAEKWALLTDTVDKLDRTVGNMLKALMVTGVIRTAGAPPPSRERMVGEDTDLPIGASTDMR